MERYLIIKRLLSLLLRGTSLERTAAQILNMLQKDVQRHEDGACMRPSPDDDLSPWSLLERDDLQSAAKGQAQMIPTLMPFIMLPWP